jgi:YfiH family protein
MSVPGLHQPDWPARAPVRALVTQRDAPFGVSAPPFDRCNLGAHCGDDPAAVAANRAGLRRQAGLPDEPRWLRQVHGVQVVRCRRDDAVSPEEDAQPLADAAVSADAGVVLAILSADCLPVLFAAAAGDEIGAAHAGWRGLAAGVLEATVAAMRTPPGALLAWLGPAAGPLAYEVGDEVFDTFLAADPAAHSAFVPTRAGHWRVDLFALARQRLARAGVRAVSGGGECTIGTPQHWYSHRRDGRSGRMASLVWLEDRG